MEFINKFAIHLEKLNYSESTINSYCGHLKRYFIYLQQHNKEPIQEEVRSYILHLIEDKKYCESSQNQAINSLKIFYQEILKKDIDNFNFPRPRKSYKNPIFLNEEEVIKIMKSVENIKYKCMIYLIYSAGLTLSEASFVKIIDIDSDKMNIFITSPKGDKDRRVPLSNKLLKLLREYFIKFKPKYWLFENIKGGQFSKRTLQKVFQQAVIKSKINKKATLTILRNSFVIHLIEKGIDIRFIQKLVGHKYIKSTMKYLEVSKKDIGMIKSPLDSLDI